MKLNATDDGNVWKWTTSVLGAILVTMLFNMWAAGDTVTEADLQDTEKRINSLQTDLMDIKLSQVEIKTQLIELKRQLDRLNQ